MRIPHLRFVAFLALFAAVTAVGAQYLRIEQAVIYGFDLAAVLFIGSCVPLWLNDEADAARIRAARDDGGRVLLSVSVVAMIVVILTALVWLVQDEKSLSGADFGIVAGTLILAWLFFNLVYALHYDHLFYRQRDAHDAGGIAFPEDANPVFSDFVYLAFTIGMTCATADIDFTTRTMRKVATLHGFLTFFFNLGVLALTINVLSNVI